MEFFNVIVKFFNVIVNIFNKITLKFNYLRKKSVIYRNTPFLVPATNLKILFYFQGW
jgi:hypothetical protein